jgi:hypothetical protein
MNQSCLRIALLLAGAAVPSVVAAQTAAPVEQSSTATPSSADTSTPQQKKERAISGDLSKALSSGIKFNPPPPPKPAEADVDLREIDKPRNGIIRLPKYVVEGQRPPIFNDRNLYSKEMLRRLAYQRYMSSFSKDFLNRYHFLGNGDIAYAMMQYEAEERKRNMAEMDDKVSLYRATGDTTEADQLKDDTQRTFMRRTEYGTVSNSGQ